MQQSTLETIANDISWIKQEVKDIKDSLEKKYVTKEEFWAVKTIVYGGASIVLVGVFGAIVTMVLNK